MRSIVTYCPIWKDKRGMWNIFLSLKRRKEKRLLMTKATNTSIHTSNIHTSTRTKTKKINENVYLAIPKGQTCTNRWQGLLRVRFRGLRLFFSGNTRQAHHRSGGTGNRVAMKTWLFNSLFLRDLEEEKKLRKAMNRERRKKKRMYLKEIVEIEIYFC